MKSLLDIKNSVDSKSYRELITQKRIMARNIKKLRTEKGYTQEKLAELSGLERRAIFYMEKSTAWLPSLYNTVKVAVALNVLAIDLLKENENERY